MSETNGLECVLIFSLNCKLGKAPQLSMLLTLKKDATVYYLVHRIKEPIEKDFYIVLKHSGASLTCCML